MAWKVEGVDAQTFDGRKATFIREDGCDWPCPWKFEVDGVRHSYSVGGYLGNHWGKENHPLDLVGRWPPITEFDDGGGAALALLSEEN